MAFMTGNKKHGNGEQVATKYYLMYFLGRILEMILNGTVYLLMETRKIGNVKA